MRFSSFLAIAALTLMITSTTSAATVKSPDGRIAIETSVESDGVFFEISRDSTSLVERSPVGFVFDVEPTWSLARISRSTS